MDSQMNGPFAGTMRGMPRWSVALLGSAAVMSLGVLVPVTPLRALIVLPLALLLPGLGVVRALSREAPSDPLPTLALSVLLSAALYPLVGLLLYLFSVHLSTTSILIAANVLVAACAARTWMHERSLLPAETAKAVRPATGPQTSINRAGLLVVVGTFAAVLGLLAVSVHSLPVAASPAYTQFSLAGDQSALHRTMTARPGQHVAVAVEVDNRSHAATTYHLTAQMAGTAAWQTISQTIGAGSAWRGQVQGPRVQSLGLHRMEITLQQGPHIVGTLSVWVRVVRWEHGELAQ